MDVTRHLRIELSLVVFRCVTVPWRLAILADTSQSYHLTVGSWTSAATTYDVDATSSDGSATGWQRVAEVCGRTDANNFAQRDKLVNAAPANRKFWEAPHDMIRVHLWSVLETTTHCRDGV